MAASRNSAQKIPVARSLNEMATKRVLDAVAQQGLELPCSIVSVTGWIVTVKIEVDTKDFTFPQITIPVFSSHYDYLPLQKGDFGVIMSIDAYLGGASGLGGGTAKLGVVPNLMAVGFVPVGCKTWKGPSDPKVRVVQGPNGVTVQTMDATDSDPPSSTIAITKDSLTLQRKDGSAIKIVMNDTNITITGDVVINGKLSSSDETDLAGGTKLVVLDGDPVSGGVVHSTATKTKAK